jgi:hypothetical protein
MREMGQGRHHGGKERRKGVVVWGWITWVVVGLVVWVVVALLVGVVIGRAVRGRDRQVPRSPSERMPTPRPPDGAVAPGTSPALLRQPPERTP